MALVQSYKPRALPVEEDQERELLARPGAKAKEEKLSAKRREGFSKRGSGAHGRGYSRVQGSYTLWAPDGSQERRAQCAKRPRGNYGDRRAVDRSGRPQFRCGHSFHRRHHRENPDERVIENKCDG